MHQKYSVHILIVLILESKLKLMKAYELDVQETNFYPENTR